jgi:hypothetical protein
MLKQLGYQYLVHCYYDIVSLRGVVTALKSSLGKDLILGDLVYVFTEKIPNSKKTLYEIAEIDLKKGISVRGLEDLEKIWILDINEIVLF